MGSTVIDLANLKSPFAFSLNLSGSVKRALPAAVAAVVATVAAPPAAATAAGTSHQQRAMAQQAPTTSVPMAIYFLILHAFAIDSSSRFLSSSLSYSYRSLNFPLISCVLSWNFAYSWWTVSSDWRTSAIQRGKLSLPTYFCEVSEPMVFDE